MAKTDWIIQGTGGQAIVDEGGSKRCQLTLNKVMLWNERDNLINAEIIGQIKLFNGYANNIGGFLLRCDSSCNNAYHLRITTNGAVKVYYLYRIVSGTWTLLTCSNSSESHSVYTKVRFRVDGNQISIEEFVAGNWQLIQLVTDVYITSGGYVGLRGDSAAGYSVIFDNIEISEKA